MPLPLGGDFKPILEYYRRYLKDPNSVPIDWAVYFEESQYIGDKNEKNALSDLQIENYLHTIKTKYRQFGHLSAKTDPLNRKTNSEHLEIIKAISSISRDRKSRMDIQSSTKPEIEKIIEKYKYYYSGSIGPEFSHINDPTVKEWLFTEYEGIRNKNISIKDRKYVFLDLIKSNEFEKFLRVKYPTKKKFGCEGAETNYHSSYSNAIEKGLKPKL